MARWMRGPDIDRTPAAGRKSRRPASWVQLGLGHIRNPVVENAAFDLFNTQAANFKN